MAGAGQARSGRDRRATFFLVGISAPARPLGPASTTIASRTIPPDAGLEQAIQLMQRSGVGTLVVVDAARRLLGLLTERDVRFVSGAARVAHPAVARRWAGARAARLLVRHWPHHRGITHQGWDLQLTAYAARDWRANFYPVGIAHSVVGGSEWERTPWRAAV